MDSLSARTCCASADSVGVSDAWLGRSPTERRYMDLSLTSAHVESEGIFPPGHRQTMRCKRAAREARRAVARRGTPTRSHMIDFADFLLLSVRLRKRFL